MNCPRCNQPTEPAAAYCGNCGQILRRHAAKGRGVPAYALALPTEQTATNRAMLSLLLGAAGLMGCLFMAMVGLLLGLFGLMMGTMSRASRQRILSNMGLTLSSLAVLASMAVWTYGIKNQTTDTAKALPAQTPGTTVVADSKLSTACYKIGFTDTLNISRSSAGCNMQAYNGQTADNSTSLYKIYANKTEIATESAFGNVAKQAIEKDIKNNLPSFKIDREQISDFAGSPAYIINASDDARGIAVVEAAVFHKAATGDNVFVLVHANGGRVSDLDDLEAQWQWK